MSDEEIKPAKDNRARVKREHEVSSYKTADRDLILDSSFMCHVGYCVDGQPFVIPTSHWREGNKLYWHGSSKSSMIKALATGDAEACVTVSHLDGLVLARSGYNTSVNYRSAICYGKPELVTERDEFDRQMKLFFDQLAPGRWEALRPMNDQEVKATGLLVMDIVDFAVKQRADGADDEDEDMSWPIWAGHVPIRTVVGQPVKNEECEISDIVHKVMPNYFKGGM